MRQRAVKADSGARGSKLGVKVCERCFSSIEEDLNECPECGAPVGSLGVIDMISAAIQPELAKANLQRMRGEYSQAADSCLHLLKRFPNNLEAHEMLGDIMLESGDLDHAIEWYELALDLDPSSIHLRRKLDAAIERRTSRESDETAEQLGLPERQGAKAAILAALAIVAICAFAAVAYTLDQNSGPRQSVGVLRAPIMATRDSETSPPALSPTVQPTTIEVQPSGSASPKILGIPAEDRTLTQGLQRTQPGASVIVAQEDPRTKNVTVTYQANDLQDPRRLGAEIAREALAQAPEASEVTVRAEKSGRLAYVADVPRARLAETETAAWQQSEPGPDAWIGYVLTNEWLDGGVATSGGETAASGDTGASGSPATQGLPSALPPGSPADSTGMPLMFAPKGR